MKKNVPPTRLHDPKNPSEFAIDGDHVNEIVAKVHQFLKPRILVHPDQTAEVVAQIVALIVLTQLRMEGLELKPEARAVLRRAALDVIELGRMEQARNEPPPPPPEPAAKRDLKSAGAMKKFILEAARPVTEACVEQGHPLPVRAPACQNGSVGCRNPNPHLSPDCEPPTPQGSLH